ncbi:MAG: class I SAM-dependent methyltransferase [Bifidobacteriaceae bacterium]|nr:class I SAM-dependent methyltransferase [Bifidobacteriaceae bacterium]
MEAGFGPVGPSERGAAAWWDAGAKEYYAEHGEFLGDAELTWCPEGLRESDAGLLGDIAGARVLEVGCGAAQGSRWVAARGGNVIGLDISSGMLREGRRLNAASGIGAPLAQGDARALPFPDAVFDVAFSAFGALPFLPELAPAHAEVARVLRPGGRWVFSVVHPMRWCFTDEPADVTVSRSYFDPTPYAEREAGRLVYAEFPHTLAEHVNALAGAGFRIERAIEPAWPADLAATWGAWGPERGRLFPGTLILASRKA